jgi:hypothetical protein
MYCSEGTYKSAQAKHKLHKNYSSHVLLTEHHKTLQGGL